MYAKAVREGDSAYIKSLRLKKLLPSNSKIISYLKDLNRTRIHYLFLFVLWEPIFVNLEH